ncbi:MAG: hypothetical protein JRJ65_10460 [Deltaproteobacteria bacterium]|nr:hypothetical protein [Deltaproteobacteria bacterium]
MREYGMSLKKIKIILFFMGLGLFCFTIVITSGSSYAQHRLVKPEWVMPEHYPEWFHGWGRIGYIGENEITINDMAFRLSPYAEFHTPTIPDAYKSLFSPGKLVGFLYDSESTIISLWLITME